MFIVSNKPSILSVVMLRIVILNVDILSKVMPSKRTLRKMSLAEHVLLFS